MATENSTSCIDLRDRDQLAAKLSQMTAILHMTYGEAGEMFRGFAEDIQDNLLWGAAQMAEECRELLSRIEERRCPSDDGRNASRGGKARTPIGELVRMLDAEASARAA